MNKSNHSDIVLPLERTHELPNISGDHVASDVTGLMYIWAQEGHDVTYMSVTSSETVAENLAVASVSSDVVGSAFAETTNTLVMDFVLEDDYSSPRYGDEVSTPDSPRTEYGLMLHCNNLTKRQ